MFKNVLNNIISILISNKNITLAMNLLKRDIRSDTGGTLKCAKKRVKENVSRDGISISHILNSFNFGQFSVFKLVREKWGRG